VNQRSTVEDLDALIDSIGGECKSPEEYQGAGTYVVLPSRSHPRLLLPRDHPAGAQGYLRAGISRRSRPQALVVSILGSPFRRGLLNWYPTGSRALVRLSGPPERALLVAVDECVSEAVTSLAFSVRPVTPHWKPTFVALGESGQVIGYGKLGRDWTTSARVAAESRALAHLGRIDIPDLQLPRLLAAFQWRGHSGMLTAPIPDAARPLDPTAPPPTMLVRHQLGQGAAGTITAGRAQREMLSAHGLAPAKTPDALLAQESRIGDIPVPVGWSHGDWVPWNMARLGEATYVWDWEHASGRSVVGVDLVHWHVLVHRFLREHDLPSSLRLGGRAAREDLLGVGLGAEVAESVARLGLLRLALAQATFFSDTLGVVAEADLLAAATDADL
jgi:hypothetical protein